MLEDLTPPEKESRCKVLNILSKLEPADVEILNKALLDRESWSHDALASALNERGLEISPASIERHRNNRCKHG